MPRKNIAQEAARVEIQKITKMSLKGQEAARNEIQKIREMPLKTIGQEAGRDKIHKDQGNVASRLLDKKLLETRIKRSHSWLWSLRR